MLLVWYIGHWTVYPGAFMLSLSPLIHSSCGERRSPFSPSADYHKFSIRRISKHTGHSTSLSLFWIRKGDPLATSSPRNCSCWLYALKCHSFSMQRSSCCVENRIHNPTQRDLASSVWLLLCFGEAGPMSKESSCEGGKQFEFGRRLDFCFLRAEDHSDVWEMHLAVRQPNEPVITPHQVLSVVLWDQRWERSSPLIYPPWRKNTCRGQGQLRAVIVLKQKYFIFSLVCSLLLLLVVRPRWACPHSLTLLAIAHQRRLLSTHSCSSKLLHCSTLTVALAVGQLHNQLIFNLIKIHLDVVSAHLLLPLVLEVEVLILPKDHAPLLAMESLSSCCVGADLIWRRIQLVLMI